MQLCNPLEAFQDDIVQVLHPLKLENAHWILIQNNLFVWKRLKKAPIAQNCKMRKSANKPNSLFDYQRNRMMLRKSIRDLHIDPILFWGYICLFEKRTRILVSVWAKAWLWQSTWESNLRVTIIMQIPKSSAFTGHANQKGDVDAASPSSCVCLESSHEEFFVAISTIDFSNHNAPDFF